MHLSDALSHSGDKLYADPEISGLKLDIHSIAQEVNHTVTHLQDIRDVTEKDNVLQDLIQFVPASLPDKNVKYQIILHPFQLP